jgi:hypothetical protein
MPKRKLFNLKNLGSWAGIKKKRKKVNDDDGDLEAEAADKENVCFHLYSTINSPSLMENRYPQTISFPKQCQRIRVPPALHSKL